MKITGDAVTSANTGVPTYTVSEEDRHVVWTIDVGNLEEMDIWDKSSNKDDRLSTVRYLYRLVDLNNGALPQQKDIPGYDILNEIGRLAVKYFGSDWLEQHAIVARNSLRRYLNYPNEIVTQ